MTHGTGVHFIVFLAYIVLTIFSFLGFWLYLIAYNKMKHTKIIGAFSFLMFALFVDSLFWSIVQFYNYSNNDFATLLAGGIPALIIKLLLAIAVIRFDITSIRDNQKTLIDKKQKRL